MNLEQQLRASLEYVKARKAEKMGTEIVKSESGALEPGAWHALREQAKAIVASGFLPKSVSTPEKAIAIMLAGRELGIGPMQAIRSLNVIDGRVIMSADLMAALVHRQVKGALLRVAESGDDECVVEAARPGQESTRYAFTIEDAQRAGLTGKDNWKKYPRAMLRARCLAEAVRATFPDCLMGVYDPDELGNGAEHTPEVLPQISPHGHAEPGETFERTPEEADALVHMIQESESIQDLRETLERVGWVTVDDMERWAPEERKTISRAFQRRYRQLQKPKAPKPVIEGDDL